jgi:Flp pilus assembly protein TadD
MQPDQTKVLSLLAFFFYTQGYFARAVSLYAALELLEPQDPSPLRGLAVSYAGAERFDLALSALDRLALRGAVDASFYLLRSQVLSALSRPEEAANAMRAYSDLRQHSDKPAQ